MTTTDITKAETAITKVADGIAPMARRGAELAEKLTFPANPTPDAIAQAAKEYAEADQILSEVHRAWKHGEDLRTEFTRPLNEVLDKINGLFRPRLDPLKKLKDALRARMSFYAGAELRWKRVEEERRRKAEEDEALKKAQAAKDLGAPKMADKILDDATKRPAPVVHGASDRAASSTTVKFKARVADLPAFLRAVADGAVDPQYVKIDTVALDKLAQATKGKLPAGFAGIVAEEVVQVGARA